MLINQKRKKVLVISNSFTSLYNFRRELIYKLHEQYELILYCPLDDEAKDRLNIFKEKKIRVEEMKMERRGKNPLKELALIKELKRFIKHVNPDLVFTLTIKPNIYGGLICSSLKIPYMVNITGLGTAFLKENLLKKITVTLYRKAMKKCNAMFFENTENMRVMKENKIVQGPAFLTSGSGINLEVFPKKDYPQEGNEVILFMGRLMKEKGIEEFLDASEKLKNKYPDIRVVVVGFYEEGYEKRVQDLSSRGVIEYHQYTENPGAFMEMCSVLVQPSYHEGMSNVCLEAAATCRPVLASDIPGCRETVNKDVSGYVFESQNADKLYETMERFHLLSYQEKVKMGEAGREWMIEHFDREKVVAIHYNEIKKVLG